MLPKRTRNQCIISPWTQEPGPSWDIFCRVVDNFGDAGVCWRLARQLAGEHGGARAPWIDDLAPLARLVPGVDRDRRTSRRRRRGASLDADDRISPWPPPDVVVEAFGVGLPDAYVAAMAQAPSRARCGSCSNTCARSRGSARTTACLSPHPRLPLERYFFFPGFTPRTGGLLREADLLRAARRIQARRALRAASGIDLGFAPPGRGG